MPGIHASWRMKLALITALVGLSASVLNSGTAVAQNCSSFASCSEAVESYDSGNRKLDRDKDGVPCEKPCGKYGENMPR